MRRSGQLGSSLLLVLSLWNCRHEDPAPAPSASASALGNDFTLQARERHFSEELARARGRFRTEPGLGDCAKILKEKPDLELCQAAASALAAIAGEPGATSELALPRLADAALALTRLSERLRYLSLAELAQRRVEGKADAGAAPVSRAPAGAGAPADVSHLQKILRRGQASARPEQRAVELNDGPVSQLMAVTMRLQHEVLRNLGAYLEYGPAPVRRAAFDTVKRLHAEHPQWPLLDHLLREAALLESDGDLKRDLHELSTRDWPPSGRPGQSAGTK